MPSYLNNAATTDTYTDTNTVLFAYVRPSFSVQIANQAVYYTLGYAMPGQRDVTWAPEEHYSVQALLGFQDPASEGLPPGAKFGGIKLRSAVTGKPARVSVM